MKRSSRTSATTYVALLRGVNVGGNNMLSMKSLKDSFQRLGFQDVSTYINSGNVLFRDVETDPRKLERKIERMLAREYGLENKVVVRSYREMADVVNVISKTWKVDPAWKYNVIFLRHTVDGERVVADANIKPDIEQVVC